MWARLFGAAGNPRASSRPSVSVGVVAHVFGREDVMSSAEVPRGVPAAYRRFLTYFYLTNSCYDLIFAYAVYTVFFRLRGLSVLQISVLLTWWSLSGLVLEIPTGALADRWNRRGMLMIAPLLKALCFVTWYLAGGNFYLYALGFLCWSLGYSFVSGTGEALLYDTLAHYGRRQEYERVLGHAASYNYLALAVAAILGGLLASIRLEWAMLFSVLPLLCTALFASKLQEMPRGESARKVPYLRHIRLALRELADNHLLRYLSIYLLGISIVGELDEFDQLYYQLVGLPLPAFGVVFCIGASISALGARFAHRLKGTAAMLSLLPFVGAVLLALVWRFPGIPGVGVLLLAYAVMTPARVLVESRIQHGITGVSRATVTSAITFLLGALTFGVPLLLGLIAHVWRLPAIYLTGGLQLAGVALWACSRRSDR